MIAALLLSATLSAAPDPVVVDSIEVTAPGGLNPLAHEPGLATIRVVGEEEERVRTLADVLERMAGVRVRRFGGLGAPATASVRGLTPQQVVVHVDGIALDSGQFGAANLSDLPLEHVERVEVYRSGVPARFGNAGLGGVVNIATSEVDGAAVNLVGGPQHTWKSFASFGRRVSGFHVSTRYRHLQSHGDFVYLDDRGTTVLNENDDRERRRENNAVREHALLSRVVTPPVLGADVTAQHLWLQRHGGIPGYLNRTYEDAYSESERHAFQLRARPSTPVGGRLDGELVGYRVSRDDFYANPSKEPGLSRADITHDQSITGARAHVFAAIPEWGFKPSLSLETRRESFQPTTEGATHDEYERTRDIRYAGVEADLWTLRDRVQLRAAYRFRRASDNYFGPLPFGRPPSERADRHVEEFHAPEFGAIVRAHSRVTLRVNRTEYARFPTLFELFGTSGEIVSNPALTAEVGTTHDARIDVELPRWGPVTGHVEVGAYISERDSLIVLLQNGAQGNFKALNLERAEARGVEVEARFDATAHLTVRGSFTTQDVRHVGEIPHWNDRWLPYVSAREGAFELTARWRGIELRTGGIFYGGYYRDPSNRTRVPAHATWHAGARVRVAAGAAVDIDVKNLRDSSVSDVYGYPMPGRSVYVGFTARR